MSLTMSTKPKPCRTSQNKIKILLSHSRTPGRHHPVPVTPARPRLMLVMHHLLPPVLSLGVRIDLSRSVRSKGHIPLAQSLGPHLARVPSYIRLVALSSQSPVSMLVGWAAVHDGANVRRNRNFHITPDSNQFLELLKSLDCVAV